MTDEDSGKTASGLMPFTLVTSVATTDATITSSSTTSSNADGSTTVTSTSTTPLAIVSEPTKISLSDSVGAEEFTYTTAVGEKDEEPEDKEKEEPVKEVPEVKPLDTSVSEHQSEEAQKTETVPSSSKEQTSNNSEERGTLLIRLRKCPTTSTSNGSENTEMTFVQQEASKNDSYCWICHEGGEVLCCDKCPRVLHLRCSNLSSEPEGDEWNCPTCRGIAKKLKRSRPPNLKELLSLAVKRMMFPGTELFQMEVTEAIAPGYRDHVFFPMDLGTIKKNVEVGKYHSTKEFLADTEWILHNCIIYNGARHVLTKTAKAIVRIAKDDMKEIELCANCYKLSVLQPTDWFAVPCVPPHRVVLAKVRGYPLWPAKLLSESSDRCDVRFFGQHDRAIVSRAGIQELRGQPPPPPNRHIHWNQAMHELTKYRDSIKEMRSTLSEKDLEHFFGKQGQLANLKFQKVSNKYLDGAGGKLERSVSPHPSTGSNYEPFSPQVVEVKVNVDPDSELRSSDMYPPMSSPDSEPELKIDFDYEPETKRKKEPKRPPHSVSPQPHKAEKSKGSFASKKSYPTGLGLGVNKSKGIHGAGVHFAKKATTTTSNDSPQKMLPTPTGFKPAKGAPGAALTSLVTHLAEKKRAEMNGFQDSPKKAKQASAVILPPSSGSPISEDAQGEEVSASLKSAFSSAYPPEKTAIAVVDPENKRVRKRKQVYTGASDLPLPSKRKPTQNNSPVRPQVASTSKNAASNISYIRSTPQVKSAGLTFDDISAIWGEGGVGSEGASPSVVIEPETSSDSELEDDAQIKDAGLLETTIQHVYQAFSTKVKSIRGRSSNDMGYRYYSEKLMSAVQHVLLEMLSDYHAGPESLELKEKLKAAWPIGVGMASALDSLRKELKKEMEAQLRMVRAAADLEREKIITEVRRQAEEEKNLAVEEATMETKKNVWCRNCWKEALYSCCWNTHYCSEECQVQHWPEHYPEHDQHLASNTSQQPQGQPSAPPRTPSFDSSAGAGGGSSFNFPITAAGTPTAIRMATPRVGALGSFPSPHPTTSTATFTFNPIFSLAPNQNTNNTGVPAITTGTLGSAGPPPLTPAPAETMTSRAGPQPIPAEITTQPINYQQLMSTGRLDQLYQAPPASSITQAAHGWTFVTTPSVLTSHASQSHPPLQRSNQTIFYH